MSKLLKTGSLLLLGSALVACGNAQGANSNEAPEKIVVAQMPNEENPNTPTLHAQFRLSKKEIEAIREGFLA